MNKYQQGEEGLNVIIHGPDGKGFLAHPFLRSVQGAVLRRVHCVYLKKKTTDWDDSLFLKVSIDQFSQNRYIPINNHRSSVDNLDMVAVQICFRFQNKPWITKKLT